jgi:alanine-alpha-ketoisovalerate/valine-pyruvate aminotransferase
MGVKFTNQQIIDAVNSVNGMVYLAARKLGCNPQTIYNRMAKSTAIREAVDNARGELIDISEQKLRAAVMNGEPWSVAMVLKTIGKSRGYVERQEVTGADGGAIIVDWDSIDNNQD